MYAERTLRDIFNQRDARREVAISLSRQLLRIGQNRLEFSLTSSHPGYLYLLYTGSDGASFDLLFPNPLDRDNLIAANRPVQLPRASWTIQARGPAGTNRLLVLVTDEPRDFSRLGLRPAGLFSSIAATPDLAREGVFSAATAAAGGACTADPAAGDIGRRCSNAFGAALVDLRELP